MKMNDDFMKSMQDAARLLQTAGPQEATAAIQRALGAMGTPGATSSSNATSVSVETDESSTDFASQSAPRDPAGPASAQPSSAHHAASAGMFGSGSPMAGIAAAFADAAKAAKAAAAGFAGQGNPLHGNAMPGNAFADNAFASNPLHAGAATGRASPGGKAAGSQTAGATAEDCGHTVRRSYNGPAGTREYLLYIPSGHADAPLPLVVMLHGCTQDGMDFATGTGMNKLAEPNVCLVAYPIQRQSDNMSKCWNWFRPGDQARGGGEAALLAGLTEDILANYSVDRKRVYVAGLSAGGAMAAILGAAYPDLFAAVGVHSGLDVGAATDVPSALAVMKSGQAPRRAAANSSGAAGLPTIVFQGDADSTVNPKHAEHIVRRIGGTKAATVASDKGQAPGGRAYSRKVITGADGRSDVEQWTIHGAGHAWAGGDRAGTYTDPLGPDASREMLRFFLAHPKAE